MKVNIFHIVSNTYWGGQEEYAYQLLSRLIGDARFYAEVICKKTPTVLQHFRRLDVPISILPLKGMTDIDTPKRMARMLKKGTNIIHVHTLTDALGAIMARRFSGNRDTRIIISLHGIRHPKNNIVYRRLCRAIDRFVFASELACREWCDDAPWFDRSKACVVRESVADNPFAHPAPDLRVQLAIPPHKVLIMFHGRLSHEKGLDTLIKAVTQLDKDIYHLVIIGDGNPKYLTEIKGIIVANQLVRNVTLLGFQEDIAHLVSQCDIGVLPSIEPEALGIANLEYMRAARPHITTDNGAQREYARDRENAIIVPPDNHRALAAALVELINDPALRQRLGVQAHDDFERNFNYNTFYRNITDIYLNPEDKQDTAK